MNGFSWSFGGSSIKNFNCILDVDVKFVKDENEVFRTIFVITNFAKHKLSKITLEQWFENLQGIIFHTLILKNL